MRKGRLLSLLAVGSLAATLICIIAILGGQANEPTDGSVSAAASTFAVLDPFDATNGANPSGSLTLSGTTLYGMTSQGGADNLVDYPVVRAMSTELSSIPSGAVACEGSVYTADPDPKGTNVRSAPQKKSPVLIVIPDDSEATVVGLSASFEDWVLIHSAQGVTSGFWFQGEGWVHASLLAVRAVHPTGRKVPLYSKPDPGSSVIKMVTGETEARLAGCMGHWMQVRIGKQKGWLAPGDYCGNPVTACP